MSTAVELHITNDPLTYDLCNLEALTVGGSYTMTLVFPAGRTVDVDSLVLQIYSEAPVNEAAVAVAATGGFEKNLKVSNGYDTTLTIEGTEVTPHFSAGETIHHFHLVVSDRNDTYVTSSIPVVHAALPLSDDDPLDHTSRINKLTARVDKLESDVAALTDKFNAVTGYEAGAGITIEGNTIKLTHDLAAAINDLSLITSSSKVTALQEVVNKLLEASKK